MKLHHISRKAVLTDGSVMLRPYRPDDVEDTYRAIRESLADLTPWLPFAHDGYSPAESRKWIEGRPGEWKDGVSYDFAIFDAGDGSFLGGCGLNRLDHPNRTANLGYWIRSSRTSRGAAPAAVILLAKWGLEELDLNRIEIVVAAGNLRSQRVAEKAGAKREGVMRNRLELRGHTHDAVLFSLIPGDVGPDV